MQIQTNPNRFDLPGPAASPQRPARFQVARACLCLLALAIVGITCGFGQQETGPTKSVLLPAVNRPPDANAQMEMRDQQNKKQSFDAANAERKRQLNEDSAKLLKLAADLKTEVDKTSKDTLSLGVIRKADEIERLARSVKEKMKLTMGSN